MRSLTVIVLVLGLSSISPAAKDEVQLRDFVNQHLNSIGTDQARGAVKSRAAEGTVQFRILNQSGMQDGKQVLVSEGSRYVALFKFPNPGYHGEKFVFDGKKTSIANTKPGSYSSFGSFVRVHPEILTEGLWGGVLSTGWALLNLKDRHPRLQDQGMKKIDGRELRQVRFTPATSTDLEILLYFDVATARHVMTSYSLEMSPQIQASEMGNARQDVTRYRLEERFDDFKETDGLSLPSHWVVQFTAQVPADPIHPSAAVNALARSGVFQFDVKETAIHHNVPLDPKNFEIK